MPHTPLGVSGAFRGRSRRSLYGDVIEELDWSVGEVLAVVQRLGLDDDTLVIFTSDNGPLETSLIEKVWGAPLPMEASGPDPVSPWNVQKPHGGSAGLFRGSKVTAFEGGVRVPFVARFPGRLPAGEVITEVGIMMDLFTTFALLAGAPVPADRPIDGRDLMPVLQGKAPSPHEAIFFYWNDELVAIPVGKYKLHFKVVTEDWDWVTLEEPMLYDVEVDPSEQFDLSSEMPDKVAELVERAEAFRAEVAERSENREFIHQMLHRPKTM